MSLRKKCYLKLSSWNKKIKQHTLFQKEKSKILPIQQLKWWEILQVYSYSIDWKKVYKSNYFLATETKLISFQIRLNLHSLVMNVQLAINDSELPVLFLFRKT